MNVKEKVSGKTDNHKVVLFFCFLVLSSDVRITAFRPIVILNVLNYKLIQMMLVVFPKRAFI